MAENILYIKWEKKTSMWMALQPGTSILFQSAWQARSKISPLATQVYHRSLPSFVNEGQPLYAKYFSVVVRGCLWLREKSKVLLSGELASSQGFYKRLVSFPHIARNAKCPEAWEVRSLKQAIRSPSPLRQRERSRESKRQRQDGKEWGIRSLCLSPTHARA